jgi:3-oxoacyl-[acyl-carrier-protein] synthase-3
MAGKSWLVLDAADSAPFRARIVGAARHLPSTRLSTAELMASTRHHTGIDLERLTGIRERRVSRGEEDSLTLATGAAQECLRRSGRDAATLDAVISCSITKYRDGLVQWLEPTTSLAVAHSIGADRAMTFDLSNACAGMLTGVAIVNNWIRHGAL